MMTSATPKTGTAPDTREMIDLVFDMDGSWVPEDYPFALWKEILRILPWMKDEVGVGVHPLRGSAGGEHTLLSKRTKLVLRIPPARCEQAKQLTGKQLNIGGSVLLIGKSRERELQAATTLHSYMVESHLGEVDFIADMKRKLQEMNIDCNLICDKFREVCSDTQSLSGHGLVLHDLKPQASLQIQSSGLGGARHYGCGIFVPFKAITGLE